MGRKGEEGQQAGGGKAHDDNNEDDVEEEFVNQGKEYFVQPALKTCFVHTLLLASLVLGFDLGVMNHVSSESLVRLILFGSAPPVPLTPVRKHSS